MATYIRTYVRIESGASPASAVASAISILRSHYEECRLARAQFLQGFPWVCIEQLGFYSMKQSRSIDVVSALMRGLGNEGLVLAAQTTAGCVAYAHYVDGTLRRFLAAGDSQWFEIYGDQEPWEQELFSRKFDWEYRVRGDSPLHEGTIPRIAAYYGLPGFATQAHWNIDRGLSS